MAISVHAPAVLDGVPLVLLHAFPLDSRMWDGVVEALVGVPIVRVDAPGFGDSPVTGPGLESFALAVVEEVRARAGRAVVAGLSMGGYVAMAVAEAAPELIAGIGLLSTKATADPDAAREKRLAMAAAVEAGERGVAVGMLEGLVGESTRTARPDVVARVRGWLESAPADGIVWAQRSMAARPDRSAVLASLPDGLPSLVLRGTEDTLMSDADAAAMASALGVGVTKVVGAGHLAAVERPAEVATALRDLYERVSAPAPPR